MKELRFHYYLNITFEQPVTSHRFTVKCVPLSDERQKIDDLRIHILPRESLSDGRDSFGNYCIFGNADVPHSVFEVDVQGRARTGLDVSVSGALDYRIGMYRRFTGYTTPGDGLKAFFGEIYREMGGLGDGGYQPLVCANKIMQRLYERMDYVPGSTNIHTTAEEAWQQQCGVCQDYSHIMIALCRMANIPARYVVGMLIGEGLSHAWVEIAQDGRWYGLDPTNNLVVAEEHIKISHGRDYNDCLINQGLFTGNTVQHQTITVAVEEESKLQERDV